MSEFDLEDQGEHIRRMMLRAIDQAFQQHIGLLFSNWVLDDMQQPERAAKGATKAVNIYKQATAMVEELEL
jgi:hypothetical protein